MAVNIARLMSRASRNEEGEVMAWVAIAPCGCVRRVIVDGPRWQKVIARDLTRALNQGWDLEYRRLSESPMSYERCVDALRAESPGMSEPTAIRMLTPEVTS